MKKPVIAVTPLYSEKTPLSFTQKAYTDNIIKAGGVPFVVPFGISKDDALLLDKIADGYLFTGGQDIDPSLYGEELLPCCQELSPERDSLEVMLFDIAYKSQKPILGICRGFQLINSLCGGTLYQDLPSQYSDKVCHTEGPFPAMAKHENNVIENTPFHKLFGCDRITTNSYHHQGVKTLAFELKPMCISPEDNLVESFYHPERKFFMGVQWHPERDFEGDKWSCLIWKHFIDSAKEKANESSNI